MTSSSGPMTGRNSGIRSIGESTHSAANPTATLARRGTAGSVRSLRASRTQLGRNAASSLAAPGGRRRARSTRTPHDSTRTMAPISSALPPNETAPRATEPSSTRQFWRARPRRDGGAGEVPPTPDDRLVGPDRDRRLPRPPGGRVTAVADDGTGAVTGALGAVNQRGEVSA